jgi:hypothetical protein
MAAAAAARDTEASTMQQNTANSLAAERARAAAEVEFARAAAAAETAAAVAAAESKAKAEAEARRELEAVGVWKPNCTGALFLSMMSSVLGCRTMQVCSSCPSCTCTSPLRHTDARGTQGGGGAGSTTDRGGRGCPQGCQGRNGQAAAGASLPCVPTPNLARCHPKPHRDALCRGTCADMRRGVCGGGGGER